MSELWLVNVERILDNDTSYLDLEKILPIHQDHAVILAVNASIVADTYRQVSQQWTYILASNCQGHNHVDIYSFQHMIRDEMEWLQTWCNTHFCHHEVKENNLILNDKSFPEHETWLNCVYRMLRGIRQPDMIIVLVGWSECRPI